MMKTSAFAIVLSLSCVNGVDGQKIFRNQLNISIPLQRYVFWTNLTTTDQKLLSGSLTYKESTWETPPFAAIEQTALLDLSAKAQAAALAYGFTEDTWDCFINHYAGYDWKDLVQYDQAKYFEALGWTQNVWDNEIVAQYPATESKTWAMLTDSEKQAAANVCYFQELWDQVPFSTNNWIKTSAFLFPPSLTKAPTRKPTSAPKAPSSVSKAPSASKAPTGGGGITVCFPGTSRVSVKGRGMIELRHAKLGDEIMVKQGVYEPIYSFGHYKHGIQYEFLKVLTNTTTLEISSSHMVYSVHKGIIPASAVKVGDELVDSDGSGTSVLAIQSVVRQGAYAPFTPSGKLIVNGITVSSYVAFQNSAVLKIGDSMETPFTYHWMAHTFNVPHRLFCQHLAHCSEEQYTADGYSTWVARPLQFTMWIFRQHPVVIFLCMVGVMSAFAVLALFELMPLTMLAVIGGYYYVHLARSPHKNI
jgi:hypothetical protein